VRETRLTIAAFLAGASLLASAHAAERQLQIAPSKAAPGGERRVALVIGNSSYKSSPLRNPVNDARAISKALAATGFSVTVIEDATQASMRRAIRVFGDELMRGGVGLFYYAGHGMQVRGRNFLIPVNADIEREDEVEDQAVDANVVLAKMDSAKNVLNLMILDACRNNPFARSFRSSALGLAQMDAPSGTLVAFATAPGAVASDGDGVNGLYTKHLLANLSRPGLPIEQLFKEVRIGVGKDTADRQVPWESSSLKGNFFFIAPDPSLSTEAQRQYMDKAVADAVRREQDKLTAERATQQRQMELMIAEMLAKQRAELEAEMRKRGETLPKPVAVAPAVDREVIFWESIKNSSNPEDYKAYLAQYPQGTFAALARNRTGAAPAPAKPAQQAAKPAEAPKPIARLEPALPPKPVAPAKPKPAGVQVASIAPTAALTGMGIGDPHYPKIGDWWQYRYVDVTSKQEHRANAEVTGISKDGILELVGFGTQGSARRVHSPGPLLSFSGPLWVFSPYLLSFGPVKAGDKWDAIPHQSGTASACQQAGTLCRYDAKVLGVEKVTTPAGEFDAVKILIDFNGTWGTNRIWRQATYWYAPAAKRMVKTSLRTYAGASLGADYDVELVAYKLH